MTIRKRPTPPPPNNPSKKLETRSRKIGEFNASLPDNSASYTKLEIRSCTVYQYQQCKSTKMTPERTLWCNINCKNGPTERD